MNIKPIPVIDLFAGPGGLNEGFSQLGEAVGVPIFETIGSFEMETSAINTLTVRSAYRQLLRGPQGVPDSYYSFIRGDISLERLKREPHVRDAFRAAETHVHQVELGGPNDNSTATIRASLKEANVLDSNEPWVLIGGPPCQAYSVAGRSRRANDENFASDKKHFLYREYLQIIRDFAPPIFVMENVTGLLSATNEGAGMFERIKKDLKDPGNGSLYDIHSLVSKQEPDNLLPSDFIIKSECYGVPQKRHRVILLGIRRDFLPNGQEIGKLGAADRVTVGDAIGGLPRLRSGISPSRDDDLDEWIKIRTEMEKRYEGAPASTLFSLTRGSRAEKLNKAMLPTGAYGDWVVDARLDHAIQHESRSHMAEDLKRYWFAANKARKDRVSPKLRQFPEPLQPNHRNAASELHPFDDRFRVQVEGEPSTTVVSHISKDGHYYIHPDPDQMRSLTVREAARLQTFPDNYFFMGSRTQQYHQVGNAVPPLLANQIARVVASLLKQVSRGR